MIDKDLIASWRTQYGDVYTCKIGNVDYYFRALTLGEIESIKNEFIDEPTSAELEESYVDYGVIHPDINIDRMKAGYITSLAEEIMRVSGLLDVEYTINELYNTRQVIQEDIIEMMKIFVLAAMPSLTEENLNVLNIKQLLKKVIQAEKILSLQQTVNGIESDGGVTFQIVAVEPEVPVKQAKSKEPVNREELLRRIRKEEKEVSGKAANLEQLDDDILTKATGTINPNDPIARKLMEALR